TPMLGSRFLKSEHGVRHGRGYHVLENGFNVLARWYESSLGIAMRFRLATLAIAVLMLAGTVYLFETMPTGFIPSQDSSAMFGAVLGPQDASFEYMSSHLKAVADIVHSDPGVQDTIAFVPGGNQSFVFAHLKPRDLRPLSVDQTIEALRP